jgi:glutamyl/glutaminyl-tRNA synthetase
LPRYQALAKQLIKEGKAYYCFCTKEQLQKQRDEALAQGQTPKYNRQCLKLGPLDIQQKLKDGVSAAIRLKMKDDTEIK